VILKADGSVMCVGCATTPAVSEVAIFLDALLPGGSPRVPGGLRYTIARGMLDVDVAPFDSLEEFSEALARHAQGARDAVVRGVLERANSMCTALMRSTRAERRRACSTATDLRRALREADARLYEQKIAATLMPARRSPARARAMPAVAACLGAGMLLIAAGEMMHSRHWMERQAMPAVAPAPLMTAAPAPTTAVSLDEARLTPVAERPAVRRSAKRPARPSGGGNRARSHRESPGVMDRLRLGWLRNAFRTSP
jgi:hypothetical protein